MPDRWVDRDPLREILVDMGRLPPPQRRFSLSEIAPGWRVFDVDRELVGRVAGQAEGYLIVERAFYGHFIGWWRVYVPPTAVSQAHERAVLLNVPRAWIGRMGWNRPPRKPPHAFQRS